MEFLPECEKVVVHTLKSVRNAPQSSNEFLVAVLDDFWFNVQ